MQSTATHSPASNAQEFSVPPLCRTILREYQEEWIAGPGEHPFYTRIYRTLGPPHGVLLFLHGNLEHVGRHEHVFPVWSSCGFAVFAYDQRGFGRTGLDVAKRAADAAYSKTSGLDQLHDLEFFVNEASRKFPGIPIFIMGFSMGGNCVLRFVTRTTQPPSPDTVNLLSGVITCSPHVLVTNPPSVWKRWILEKIRFVSPHTYITITLPMTDMSHNEATNKAYLEDPLVKNQNMLVAIGDLMGEELAKKGFRNWPRNLPLLTLHGTADRINSAIASKKFHDDLPIGDDLKTYIPFTGGLHELHNEPDGVSDKFIETCISWVEMQLSRTTPNAEA